MIVCNICGTALPGLQTRCNACSGKGIEKPSPVRNLLTPTQRRGSPDRWAKNYTTPPGRSGGSPLAKEHSTAESTLVSTPRHGAYLDVQATPGADLARVYGTLLDKDVGHPRCAACATVLSTSASIYIPSPAGDPSSTDALCRPCYSLQYAKGQCEKCHQPVVGDEKGLYKGAHVRGRGNVIWHADCFSCKTCNLGLYKEEHLLCVRGQPYCLSCYDATFKTTEHPDLAVEPPILPSRDKNDRPAPPSGRRRFAPPGLVISNIQPSKSSSSASIAPRRHSPSSPLSSSITYTKDQPSLPSYKAQDRKSINDQAAQTVTEIKGPRGQYRNTVRSLAERFEPPPKVTKTPLGPVGASTLNRPNQDTVGSRSGTGPKKTATSRDTASRPVGP